MKRRNVLQIVALFFCLLPAQGCDEKGDRSSGKTAASQTASNEAPTGPRKLSIVTGSKSGNYYKAATELKQVLPDSIELEIRESAGSFSNIAELGTGKADLAIAQFDALKVFLKLGKKRAKMAQSSLVVAPLGLEHIHVLVNQDAEIDEVSDLAGKRISVGPEHSGSWLSAWSVMFHMNGVNIEKSDNIFKQPYEEAIDKLVKGEIDVLFVTTAPGMPLLTRLGPEASMAIDLMSFGEDFDIPEGARSSYLLEKIPGGTYPFKQQDVYTLATPSYLLANAKLDDEQAKSIASTIYGKTAELTAKSDMWKNVSKERVEQDLKNNVPYHPGVKAQLGL